MTIPTQTALTTLRNATTDEQVISLWLFKKADGTQKNYIRIVLDFLGSTGKPLPQVTLADLQIHINQQTTGPSTQRHKTFVLKSLFSFATRIGYLPLNPAAALIAEASMDNLVERILSEEEVAVIIDGEDDPRNHCLLRLLYCSGARVSEICQLTWRDCLKRGEVGQISVIGKGNKRRTILLSSDIWDELIALRCGRDDRDPVFARSQDGRHMTRQRVHQIVQKAAKRVGVTKNVSPHWFRHAHASHSLDNGAPPNLVKETLGHASLATTSAYTHARPNESSGLYLK